MLHSYTHGSLYQYDYGWIIRPNKQEPIVVSIPEGYILARTFRVKNDLYTLREASEKYARYLAEMIAGENTHEKE
jgi:hypothetical protein